MFFLLSSLASATPAVDAESQALWRQSLAAYQSQDFKLSHRLLYKLVKRHPKNALYWFNLGNTFFMLKSYSRAEICFRKVEILKSPLAPAASLYRAKAMVQGGKVDEAEPLLMSLIKANIPPALKDEASHDLLALRNKSKENEALRLYREGQYKRALRAIYREERPDKNLKILQAMVLIRLDREDEAFEILKNLQSVEAREIRTLVSGLMDRLRDSYSRKTWFYLEAAAGYDNNYLRAPSGTSATPVVIDFGGGARWWTRDLWYANTGYNGHLYDVPSHVSERVISHELRANVGREIATDLLLFSPHLVHETYGATAARMASGLSLKLRGGEEYFEYGLDADWTLDNNLADEFSYLKGSSQRYRIYFGSVRNPIYGRIFLTIDRKHIGDQAFPNGDLIPAAHNGLGPGVRVLWRLSRSWVTEGNFSYFVRTYATEALPGNELREDQEFSASFRVTNLVAKKISLYASAGFVKNSSTLGENSITNPNYTQTQILVGALWDAN